MGKRWVGPTISAILGVALQALLWGLTVAGITIPPIFGIISIVVSAFLILAAVIMAFWWYALPFIRTIGGIRLKQGKGRKMLFALGILLIIGGLITVIFQLNFLRQDTTQALRTFSYDIPSPEYLDKEMDFHVSGWEEFVSEENNSLLIIIAHTMITNRSDNAKNIVPNMAWEFRLKDRKEATRIPLLSYEPPDNSVAKLKAKLESERQYSLGDYLKFPLLLEPHKSVKGFMLFFTMDKETFDKYLKEGMPDPTIDTRIYLEWDNLNTGEYFRMKLIQL